MNDYKIKTIFGYNYCSARTVVEAIQLFKDTFPKRKIIEIEKM